MTSFDYGKFQRNSVALRKLGLATCKAIGCGVGVPRNIFMCARHWRMVPKPLRTAIRESWSIGGGSPYRANCDEAIRVVAASEGGRRADGVTAGMKALTVWQPWASLIMIGAKSWEFRRWNFADKPHLAKLVGQRIVLHAGARKPKTDELRDIRDRIAEGESALRPDLAGPYVDAILDGILDKLPLVMPMAAALGTVTIGEPKRAYDLFVNKVADSDRLDQHMYAWPMIDPQPFAAPIPAAGAQGFWNWS